MRLGLLLSLACALRTPILALQLGLSAGSGNTGDSITPTATGGVGPYTYSVDTNVSVGFLKSQSEYVLGPKSGTDVLKVTDSLGATATANVVVTGPQAANMVLWGNNDTLTAGALATWADSSPIGGNITANGSPVVAADAGIGNKLAIPFDGSTQYLVTAATRAVGAYTFLLVYKASSSAGQLMHQLSGNSNYMFSNTGNSINTTKGGSTSGKNLSANWGINASFRTACKIYDGSHAGHKLRINGVEQTLSNGSGTADPGTGTLTATIGIMAQNGGASKSTGSVAEVFAYNAALTATEAGYIETYLKKKLGHY